MRTIKKPQSRFCWLIRDWAVPAGCGLVILFLLKFVFFFGYVPSASMEPAIKEGSFIFGIQVFGELAHREIVVFERENRLLLKRIAGVPGDVVFIGADSLTVPDGCYFVLGDNEGHSIDSRYWDDPFVSQEQVAALILRK